MSRTYQGLSDYNRVLFMDGVRTSEYSSRGLTPTALTFNSTNTNLNKFRNQTGPQLFAAGLATMTTTEQSYMNLIESKLDNYSSNTQSLVADIEESISNDNTLSTTSRNTLLASIAVAKFSALFWDVYPEYQGFNGVWKADWYGFWAGYHSGEINYSWRQQISNGIDMAGTASEIQRQM